MMKKVMNYLPFFVLLSLPLLFYPGVDASGWRSSSDVHAFFEFASSLLAITAGVMVLLHFFTTGRWFFLIISIGFVLIGAEEFVHAIFSFNRIWPETSPTFKLAISTTWLSGHFILLTSFFIALLFGAREIVTEKRRLNAIVYNIIGLICAASITLLIFIFPFHPNFVQLGSITKKLIEISFALLFFAVFIFYSNIYFKQQSRSPLLWGIIACLIFQVLVHIFVFDAQTFYDSHWDTAHLIVFLSYFFPIFGVWGETIKLHKSAQVQVIELEKEMTERKRTEEMLRRTEENFRRSLDDSPLGVRIVTEQGETIYANRAILDIYGYNSIEELNTTPVRKRYTPESYAEFQIRKEKRKRECDGPSEYDISILRKDGEVHDLRVFRKEILWDRERQYQVIYRDITGLRQAEESLRESEKRYRGLFENAVIGVSHALPDGRLVAVNTAYAQMYGYANAEEMMAEVPHVGHLYANPEDRDEVLRVLREEGVMKPREMDVVRRDGTRFIVLVGAREIRDSNGNLLYYQAEHTDITERKRAEEELRASRLQLRALASRLQQIREEERIVIAREIHDEMGGGLTGLRLDLSWLLRKIDDIDPIEARVALMDKIHTSNALIDQMIRVVRRISTNLRPSVLDDLGLIAALEWQLSEFTSRTEIQHEFAPIFEYVDMEEATAVAVFRIFQEALTNVVRHSRATKVVVVLREGERSLFGDESFVLEIRDNGRGITEEEILNPESLGLLGMKERVLTFGGGLSIHGEPGGGTALVLKIPRIQGEPS
jgi:PAS domain S-box-containing protein